MSEQKDVSQFAERVRVALTADGDMPGALLLGVLLFDQPEGSNMMLRTLVDVPPVTDITPEQAHRLGMMLIHLSKAGDKVRLDLRKAIEANPPLLHAAVMGMKDAADDLVVAEQS